MFVDHDVVEKIGQLQITGNVIPTSWFRNITFANGKPHFVAITILAEIVYWYRPMVVRDEQTGQILRMKKKFKDDMLQKSYQSFAEKFGFSKRQAKEAIDYLVERGLIRREFRSIRSFSGTIVNNVMFVEPIPENIVKITFENDLEMTSSNMKKEEEIFHPTSSVQTEETVSVDCISPSVGGEEGPTFERETNTENKQEYKNKFIYDDGACGENARETSHPNEKVKYESTVKDENDPFTFFEENGFGTVGSFLHKEITKWCQELSKEQVVQAMQRAVLYGGKSWAYVEKILKNWKLKESLKEHNPNYIRKKNPMEKPTKGKATRKEPIPDWLQKKEWEVQVDCDPDFEKMKEQLKQRLQKYGYQEKVGIA